VPPATTPVVAILAVDATSPSVDQAIPVVS